jgi:hypothetical protein
VYHPLYQWRGMHPPAVAVAAAVAAAPMPYASHGGCCSLQLARWTLPTCLPCRCQSCSWRHPSCCHPECVVSSLQCVTRHSTGPHKCERAAGLCDGGSS